jgi:hypothetical protein
MSFHNSRVNAALETAQKIGPEEFANTRRASLWTAVLVMAKMPLPGNRLIAEMERKKTLDLLMALASEELSSEFISKHMTPMMKMFNGDIADMHAEVVSDFQRKG